MNGTRLILLLFAVCAADPAAVAKEEGPRPAGDLLRDFKSANYQVRRRAVLAVEGRAEPELFEAVLRMAKEDDHPNIRSYCADVLGTYADERIFPLLVTMTAERWPGPRSSAFVAMGRLRDPRAYPILVRGLSDKSCRGYAAKGLGLLGDERAFEPILEVWRENPRDGFLVDLGPEALARLDEQRAIGIFLGLFSEEGKRRWHLVRVLREHPRPGVREAMTGHLGAEDADLRRSALQVLAATGDGSTVDPLLEVLRKHPADAALAALALAAIGDRSAARPIAVALRSAKEPTVKVDLIGALADLGGKRAVADLVAFVGDETYTAQPREISSIWGFPHNLRVGDTAVWAVLTLIDGKEPFPRNHLCSHPRPIPATRLAPERKRIETWWKPHETDPIYRLPN